MESGRLFNLRINAKSLGRYRRSEIARMLRETATRIDEHVEDPPFELYDQYGKQVGVVTIK